MNNAGGSSSFIIVENDLPGKFDIQKLQQAGIKPGPFCSRLKAGESVTLDDGRVLSPLDYVGPSRAGRRLVILGDCCDATNILPFAQHCDVLVHECTHDDTLREKAIEFGHSTPAMATTIAEKCDAKCLLLNHFSQRYKPKSAGEKEKPAASGDAAEPGEEEEESTVDVLLEQAKSWTKRPVFIADDFFTYTVPTQK